MINLGCKLEVSLKTYVVSEALEQPPSNIRTGIKLVLF